MYPPNWHFQAENIKAVLFICTARPGHILVSSKKELTIKRV